MNITDYITDFQHIGIPATDLDETVTFYQKLGFEIAGAFYNGANRCTFLKFGHLMVETWEGDATVRKAGAINHISLDTNDVEHAFAAAKEQGFDLVNDEIQEVPSFWEHGIRFFNILGPNQEKIEFCQVN